MLLGLIALGGATVIICLGKSIAVLAIGRVLQGISASVPWVVGLSLMVDTVGSEGIGQAMGYVGLSMSMAMLVAPLLGGIVFAEAGFYSVFAMAFGLIILDIFLRVVMIEKKVAVKWLPAESLDPVKEKAVVEESQDTQPTDEAIKNSSEAQNAEEKAVSERPDIQRTTSVASAASAAEEILPESTPGFIKRFASRLPPVVFLLTSRRLLSAIFACLVQSITLTGFDTILPLYVRDTFNWTSIGAGLIFLPIVVVSLIGPVFGRLSDKHGPRWYATVGYTLACPFLILLRLVNENTIGDKILLCALLALIGVCLTIMVTPMMAEITYAVTDKAARRPPGYFGPNGAYAQAYALFNVAWAGGCLIGPLLAGLVTAAHGWGVATLILGIISLVTAIPVVIYCGGSIFKKRKQKRQAKPRHDGSVIVTNTVSNKVR